MRVFKLLPRATPLMVELASIALVMEAFGRETVPVMVSPPAPCKSPVPELTPTAVTAPAEVTLNGLPEPTLNA